MASKKKNTTKPRHAGAKKGASRRDVGELVLEGVRREQARTADLARMIGPLTSREALLVQALVDPPDYSVAIPVASIDSPARQHNEWPAFRALFPHKLRGADDALLEQVRAVVQIAAEALEVGDVEGLRLVAGTLDSLVGLRTKDDRRRAILATVKAWIEALPAALTEDPAASLRLPFATAWRLAGLGMPVPSAVEAIAVPEIVAHVTKPFGPWGAPEATARLMRACGYDGGATEHALKGRLTDATKNKKKKKSKVKKA